MTLHGIIQNGVVVLDAGTNIPEGTEVAVFVPTTSATSDVASVAEWERRRKALAELLAIPDENPGDTFSGADHDQVLYGEGT
jgi:hypothetical protein